MKETRTIVYNTGVALASPLISLFIALRTGNKKIIRWTITLFATLFASTFTMQSQLGDGVRHWENVYAYYVDLSLAQFFFDLFDIVFFISNPNVNEDVYIHVISYLSGGILGMPGLFFVIVGLVYGYFFAGSMVRLFDTFPSIKSHFPIFILALYFILLLNLQSMNTVRTWTGFWILFYGVISYYQTGNKKYILLILLPPLVHLGYFIMVLPAWAIIFINSNKKVITTLFFLSFSASLVTPQAVTDQLSQFEVGEEKIRGYYVEEQTGVLEQIQSQLAADSRWYLNYKRAGVADLALYGIAILFIANGTYISRMNYIESNLFSIGLLTKALSNSTWFLFAVSNRSNTIAMLFILAGLYLYWQRQIKFNKKFKFDHYTKLILNMLTIPILLVFFFHASNIIEYTSIFTLFTPFIVWISEDVRYSIREILGMPFGL